MTDRELKRIVQQDIEWIDARYGAFGLWIDALWPSHLEIPYVDQEEVFFFLLKYLLDEGKVYLEEPAGAEFGEKRVLNADVWAAPHDHMIEHIKRYWPKDVTDADDIRLTGFWYDIHCPKILWLDEAENKLIGS